MEIDSGAGAPTVDAVTSIGSKSLDQKHVTPGTEQKSNSASSVQSSAQAEDTRVPAGTGIPSSVTRKRAAPGPPLNGFVRPIGSSPSSIGGTRVVGSGSLPKPGQAGPFPVGSGVTPSGRTISGPILSPLLARNSTTSARPAFFTESVQQSPAASATDSALSAAQQQAPSQQVPSTSEESKASKWLAAMQARSAAIAGAGRSRPGGTGVLVPGPSSGGAGPQGMDVDPVPGATAPGRLRSSLAGVRFAGSHSDGEDSDAESALGSTDGLLQVLQTIADISAFNAECLAKLSGVPMPDFDVDAASMAGAADDE